MARRDVMVTTGANQAFAHALLAVCDPGDEVILFRPYYFSHLVAVQLLGLQPVFLDCDAHSGLPDVGALHIALQRPAVRACVLVSPSNPTGAVCPTNVVARIRADCHAAGTWLISDEAYEHFLFGSAQFSSPLNSLGAAGEDECVLSLHTFSKSYGLAAWRVGYLSYPVHLHDSLLKVQDTLPTHACRASQRVALAALDQLGTPWVEDRVGTLDPARRLLWEAVRPLHDKLTPQPDGAFYYWLPLPPHLTHDDEAAVRWLAEDYNLLLLPGSAFGRPGFLRLAYGTLADADAATLIAERLSRAVDALQSDSR